MGDGRCHPSGHAIYKYTVILLHCSKMSIRKVPEAVCDGLNRVLFVTKSRIPRRKSPAVTIGGMAYAS